MTRMFPYMFQNIGSKFLISNDTGDFFLTSHRFLEKVVYNRLNEEDQNFLLRKGFCYNNESDFYYNSHINRLRNRKNIEKDISYIIAIPTLRCDLSCSYCQVSRANIDAKDFDWTEDILNSFKEYILKLSSQKLKIEFQGGEPSLRIDIIEDIINYCDKNLINVEFILCTNLNNISPALEKLLNRKDFYISTSIDGSYEIHTQNRTNNKNVTSAVMENYKYIKEKYGSERINALPTITSSNFEEIKGIIDYYTDIGQSTIFLRPVNHQGFARKKFSSSENIHNDWFLSYKKSLDYIFELNFTKQNKIIEIGLETAIKRVFLPSYNSYVDLRSPNPASRDYVVVNYDGDLYPSDEARMLSRIRHIDLKLGNIKDGIQKEKRNHLNWNQMNEINEDCIHCSYKPFCGVDNIDDISRYNRTDLIKSKTYFCKSNMNIFNFIFSKIEQNDPVSFYNFQGHLTGEFSMNTFTSNWLYD